MEVNIDKRAKALFHLMEGDVRTITQTYVGVPVISGIRGDLQALVTEKISWIFYCPLSQSHFEFSFTSSLSNITDCKFSFTTLCGVRTFFTKSPKWFTGMCNILENYSMYQVCKVEILEYIIDNKNYSNMFNRNMGINNSSPEQTVSSEQKKLKFLKKLLKSHDHTARHWQ